LRYYDIALDYLRRFLTFVRRDERILRYLTLLLIGGFALLSLLVLILPPEVLDVELSREVQEDRSPWLDASMHFISWFGNGYVPGLLPLICSLVFLGLGARREALFTTLTLLSGVVIYVIKLLIDRPRPTADLIEVFTEAQFQSFPSGHVTFYVTFFGFLVYLMYRLRWVWTWLRWSVAGFGLLLIFGVGFSRMYLGAHWFTDVLGGFLIGLLCLIGLTRWYARRTNSPDQISSPATEA
jgi:undecaprenyl-diphosphatase